MTASPSAQGGQGSVVRYRAEVTPYAVSISTDRDESFHKGANGQPESNLTNVLTPRFGDTAVDPSNYQASGDSKCYNVAVGFTGELIGFSSNANCSWSLAGLSASGNPVSRLWQFSDSDFAAMATNPQSKAISLTVSDSGGVRLTANYTLRIHHGLGAQHGSIYAASIEDSLWSFFFATATVGINDLGPKSDQGDASFNDCWKDPDSTFSSGADRNDPSQWRMAPHLKLTYRVKNRQCDLYGQHGYSGPYHMGVSEVLPYKEKFWGDFGPLSQSRGGGGGGS